MKKYYVSPSLMCVDLLNLKEELQALDKYADFYHIDIMDGHFVPNITLSASFIKGIAPVCTKPIDAHLMVTDPGNYIDDMISSGAGIITVHAETINANAFRTIRYIKEKGAKVGIALNPATPLDYAGLYLNLVDKITIMAVDPGFAGQKFIPEVLPKIAQAAAWRAEKGYSYLIEVDGCANMTTFADYKKAGVDIFVGGSGLFNKVSKDHISMEEAIIKYKEEIDNA